MGLSVRPARNTEQDLDIHVTAQFESSLNEVMYDAEKFTTHNMNHHSVKVMAILYAIEGGVKVWLFWETKEGTDALLVPLEGRGLLDFSRFGGVSHPAGATGRIILRAEGPIDTTSAIALSFELVKQRT